MLRFNPKNNTQTDGFSNENSRKGKLARFLSVCLFILFSFNCHAQEIDLSAIAQIESSGNPLAVSYRGAKYGRGLYQISEVALQDYNRRNNATIKPEQLFDPQVCHKVAKWYFKEIRRFLSHFGLSDTIENQIIAYSWGIGNLVKYRRGEKKLPRETINYLKKYKRLAK